MTPPKIPNSVDCEEVGAGEVGVGTGTRLAGVVTMLDVILDGRLMVSSKLQRLTRQQHPYRSFSSELGLVTRSHLEGSGLVH